ncbi:Na+/H+ antiporter [Mucilaginibacter roseus]|uniref:Na+/H+ antiporter n=1 Tax=Mucilaginibacter roseus TaxID=1528868 RepID=A0ABS8TWK9_9SPHI|nr:Na+/H+ antiporter [Mucilaginibacter roseus]MCD8739249.1 Na+/H+ antiporter [Mucilaginibacter roseus]
MLDSFPFYLSLAVAIVLIVMLANRIKVAYPVLLVLAGLALSIIPGIPQIHINSELIFVIFLPPLLYEAGWQTSWKELWRWRRIISSFAFVVVFFTAFSVAWVANYWIPGFTLALGFLLGGIVSPPDAVSTAAILKFIKVPKRMTSILEGESLLNDASSLIIFRFAFIAVGTGQFVWHEAAVSFVWMVIGGIVTGILIAYAVMQVHKILPTDANMDIILTLVTPYGIYICAEEVHSSGVLAVVAGSLFLSYRRHSFLSSTARLRSSNVWESLSFILNGLVFLLIGLDLPQITAELGNVSMKAAIGYGLLITGVLVITRIIAAYGAVVVTLIARNFITVADDRHPGFRTPLILGWAGMRGVVSLAAALSIPTHLQEGVPFPQRNLILFITFIVILTTLLLQGLTLPLLIRKIGLPTDPDEKLPEEKMYAKLRKQLNKLALKHLEEKYPGGLKDNPALQQMAQKWRLNSEEPATADMPDETKDVYSEILEQQRNWLIKRNLETFAITEEVIRKHLLFLDLEEEKLKYL